MIVKARVSVCPRRLSTRGSMNSSSSCRPTALFRDWTLFPPPNGGVDETGDLAVGEAQFVVANVKHVAFIDALVINTHAFVIDAVGRSEILNVEHTVATDHRRVLARDVAVFDR